MVQRNNKNLIAPNQDASKLICHLWSRLPRIGALVSQRLTIYVVPHLDATLGKVGGTFPSLDYFGKELLAPPAGETHSQQEPDIAPSAALLVEENAFCLLLSKLLKYNYTPNRHFPQLLQCQTRNPTPKSKHQTSSLKNENKFSNPKALCFCD